MTVREVHDVFEAYKLLTGKKLPEPIPLPEGEMRIPSSLAAVLSRRVVKLIACARVDLKPAAFHRDPKIDAVLKRARSVALSAIREAEAQLAGRRISAAYLRAFWAASLARASARLRTLHGATSLQWVSLQLKAVDAALDKQEEGLKKASKASTACPLGLLGAFGSAVQARGLLEVAETFLKPNKGKEKTGD